MSWIPVPAISSSDTNDSPIGSFNPYHCPLGCAEKINFPILICGQVDYGVVGYTKPGNDVKNVIKAWEGSLKFTYFWGQI